MTRGLAVCLRQDATGGACARGLGAPPGPSLRGRHLPMEPPRLCSPHHHSEAHVADLDLTDLLGDFEWGRMDTLAEREKPRSLKWAA